MLFDSWKIEQSNFNVLNIKVCLMYMELTYDVVRKSKNVSALRSINALVDNKCILNMLVNG